MKKKIISLLLACLMLIMSACGNAPDETKETGEQTETEDVVTAKHWSEYENKMNVLSFNVYYQNVEERKDNVIDLILKNDPDVLLLQEVSVEL